VSKKKIEIILLIPIFFYSLYCSITIGASWDEFYHYKNGDNIFRYILSLGTLEYKSANFIYHYGFYDFLASFFSKNFTKNFLVESHHIFNLFFSIGSIFGIYQVTKKLFNLKIAKICFLLCIFNPIYFGHFSINPKDTIIAFSYIWIFYIILKYFQSLKDYNKRVNYVIYLIFLLSLGLSIRLTFLVLLLPLFLILLIEFFKKENIKNLKLLLIDLIIIFVSSFIITIIFWPDTHGNILKDPFVYIFQYFDNFLSSSFGLPFGIINGSFYEIQNTPWFYLFISLFHKLPIYILMSFLLTPFLFLDKNFKKKFLSKNYFYVFINIIFLFLMVLIFKPGINDGIRYFLYIIPLILIISSLTIFYIFQFSNIFFKSTFIILIIFNLFTFFKLTPYHYAFINILNGKYENNLNKYEVDYWGTSLKELVIKSEKEKLFTDNKRYLFSSCGLNQNNLDFYLDKYTNIEYSFVSNNENYDYIFFINRLNDSSLDFKLIDTCYNNFFKKEVLSVKRNNLSFAFISK